MMMAMEQLFPLALAGALEGAGVPWPGIVIVAGAGMAAGSDWKAIGLLTAAFALAYSVGALAQYAAGRAFGPVALAWLPKSQRTRIEALMQKHGSSAVLWSRPLAWGNYVSAPAGMLRMPLIRFLTATFVGILPWAFAVLFLATAVGSQVGGVQALMAQYTTPLVALAGGAAVASMVWKYTRRRSDAVA